MWRVLFTVLLAGTVQSFQDQATRKLYHSSENVDKELISLSKKCKELKVSRHTGPHGDATLTSVSFNKPGGDKNKLKVMLFFGEHSRELISVETGLAFIQHLCGEGKSEIPKDLVNYNMNNAEFLIFTNIGVNSRRLVERGKYCLRVNSHGVDLNRNWKDHWKSDSSQAETSPGKAAFTEDETVILRDSFKKFKPHMFLTVHSGTLGMYIPYAYSNHKVHGRTVPEMLKVLNRMNPKYCNCNVGAAGKEVGYLCPGTSLDYIYDYGTKYSFAFEVYESGMFKREAGMSMVENGPGSCMLQKTKPEDHAHHHHDHNHDIPGATIDASLLSQQSRRKLLLRGMSLFPPASGSNSQCLDLFNPTSVEQYKGTIKNWVSAYLELVQEVHKHHVKDL